MEDTRALMEQWPREDSTLTLNLRSQFANRDGEPFRRLGAEDIRPNDRVGILFRKRFIGVSRIGAADRLEILHDLGCSRATCLGVRYEVDAVRSARFLDAG
jgi:hypothetical protein